MSNSTTLKTNRFVIRKSLIGKNTIITFKTNKGKTVSYNHSNNIPAFCRDLAIQS
jgi:hypothetical protein